MDPLGLTERTVRGMLAIIRTQGGVWRTMDTQAILATVLSGYSLSVRGIHGVAHWARVLENALRLAPDTGADPEIVTLFALFHDPDA